MNELSFPDDDPIFDFHVANIVFYAETGLRRIRCAIDCTALQEHFGATGPSQAQWMRAFEPGPAYREALATLEYGVDSGMGFVMVTGEIGMGKTTLIRSFLRRAVRPDLCIIYLFHPLLTFRALVAAIAEELGLPVGDPEPHQ